MNSVMGLSRVDYTCIQYLNADASRIFYCVPIKDCIKPIVLQSLYLVGESFVPV